MNIASIPNTHLTFLATCDMRQASALAALLSNLGLFQRPASKTFASQPQLRNMSSSSNSLPTFCKPAEGCAADPVDGGKVQKALPPATEYHDWRFRPDAYTAREFMREISILFESVIVQLGPDGPGEDDSRAILLDGLLASLSHEGREATLRLVDWNSEQPSGLTRHILSIGKTLFQYASEFNHATVGNPSLKVYSPCEGHKWLPPAGRLLRSHRSSPALMMLYNEWLHQITCLRDYLIGFDNFEEVVLILDNTARPGTRPMEDVRVALLERVARGNVSRQLFLETAKVLTAPGLPAGGFGFQYSRGVIMPASVHSHEAPDFLFHFSPTQLAEGEGPRQDLLMAAPEEEDADLSVISGLMIG